jgi:hypothetical protein
MSENTEEIVVEDTPKSEVIFNPTSYEMQTSDTIGELAGALAKAQGEMSSVGKGKQGYGYKYADLASIIDAARPALSKNELAVSQSHTLMRNPTKPSVLTQTLLMHSSGEWIKSSLDIPLVPMKQLSVPQMIGVSASYSRRYLYQAIVGLAAEEDTDASLNNT